LSPVSEQRAKEILGLDHIIRREKIMENTDNMVSGKIIKKWVKPGVRGNTIGFIVLDHGQEKMVSVFESKLTPEMKAVIMALVEGMFAEFEVIANVSKTDGKTYLNIVTATPVTQLRDDAEQPAAPSGPSNRLDAGKKAESPDTRVRSMALAYAKDLVVAGKVDLAELKSTAEWFEAYILTGE
jgi:hypothetical protein